MKATLILLVLLCFPVIHQAQMTKKVSGQFPAHIVYKIDEINSKLNLSEDELIKIGRKLYTADSLANASLSKGEPAEQLKAYYTIDSRFLKSVLTPEQLDRYGYMTDQDNRFLAVLIFATHLKLDPAQISEIRRLNDSVADVPKMSQKETIRVYNKKLTRILTQKQYISMLKTIYHEQSEEEAKKDWAKITKLGLVADKKDMKEYTKILNYHISKNAYLDKKADRYEKTKRDFMAKKMALSEPPVLLHANILSGEANSNNKYASIIKYEKELELTRSQTDTLLLKYNQLESTKLENKEKESTAEAPKTVPSEYEILLKY